MSKKFKIAILGNGHIGQAIRHYFLKLPSIKKVDFSVAFLGFYVIIILLIPN